MEEKDLKYNSILAILKLAFSLLEDVTLEKVIKQSKVLSAESGETILYQNHTNTAMIVLLDGILTIELPSKKQNHIVHFIQKGEVFYANECFLEIGNQSNCNALVYSTILLIPASLIKEICSQNPAFLMQILTFGCKEKTIFELHASNLLGNSVRLRFINALKTLSAKFSDNNYLPIQPNVIGNFILASKSSLIRTLAELESEKIIVSDKNGIKILQKKLLETK